MTDDEAMKRLDRLMARVENIKDADAIQHAQRAIEDRAALESAFYGWAPDKASEELMKAARRHMRGEP